MAVTPHNVKNVAAGCSYLESFYGSQGRNVGNVWSFSNTIMIIPDRHQLLKFAIPTFHYKTTNRFGPAVDSYGWNGPNSAMWHCNKYCHNFIVLQTFDMEFGHRPYKAVTVTENLVFSVILPQRYAQNRYSQRLYLPPWALINVRQRNPTFCSEFFLRKRNTRTIKFLPENERVGITLDRHQLYFNEI